MIIAHNASLYAVSFCSLLCGVIMIMISVDGRGAGERNLGREIWGGKGGWGEKFGEERGAGERNLGRKGGWGEKFEEEKGAGGEKFGGRERRKENLSVWRVGVGGGGE